MKAVIGVSRLVALGLVAAAVGLAPRAAPRVEKAVENVRETIREDVECVFERDPAARSVPEVVLFYPGMHAIWLHRLAHTLYRRNQFVAARGVSHLGRLLTGIEIHPGAIIGRRCFIDHGMGVVIGETTEIGDDALIYQGATLGGTSKSRTKRHPTLGNRVEIGAGASVLGPIEIGDDARVGAGSVVIRPVPPGTTVVGVPGRVFESQTARRHEGTYLDHANLPDPVARVIEALVHRVERLENQLEEHGRAGVAAHTVPSSDEDADVINRFMLGGGI
jgi:serine O-acetyltransferase